MAETAEIHQNKKLEKAAIHQTKKLKNCWNSANKKMIHVVIFVNSFSRNWKFRRESQKTFAIRLKLIFRYQYQNYQYQLIKKYQYQLIKRYLMFCKGTALWLPLGLIQMHSQWTCLLQRLVSHLGIVHVYEANNYIPGCKTIYLGVKLYTWVKTTYLRIKLRTQVWSLSTRELNLFE
jgi:hypothetical protein